MNKPITLLLAASLLATDCVSDGVATAPTDNPDVSVTLLFEHDGCKVYRFSDATAYHYYAVCRGAAPGSASQRINCGKNCWREDTTPTAPDASE